MKYFVSWMASLLLFLTTLGCIVPEPSLLVPISNPPAFRSKSPREIKTIEEAMAAVITVTGEELGLPLVEPLYLHLHKNAESFRAYAGKYGRRLPPDVAQFAVTVAEENRFHINMEKI